MYKTILVYTYINKCTEINNISYCTLKYHSFFKIFHLKNITSKNTVRLYGSHLRKEAWRNTLVNALLGSPDWVRNVVSVFREQPDAGMVCSGRLYGTLNFPEDGEMLTEELSALGLQTDERRFCVGNMFAIRPCLLAPLGKREFRADQFPAQSISGSGGTLAHLYERVFSLLAPSQGYRVVAMDPPDAAYARKMRLRKVLKPFLSFLFNIDWEGNPRRKVLTILGFKITLHENRLPD